MKKNEENKEVQQNIKIENTNRAKNRQNGDVKRTLFTGKVKVIVVCCLLALVIFGAWQIFDKERTPSEKLVFTVGTEEVYLDEVNYCILQNVLDLGITADSLSSVVEEAGTDSATYYKQLILEWIMDYKVEYLVAKEQGITLTEEELSEVQKDVTTCLSNTDARLLNRFHIEREVIEDVYEQIYLAKKLEKTVTENVEVEEQKYCTMYIMLFPIIEMQADGSYATLEDGVTPILLSEEEIQQRREDADNALEELKEGEDAETVAEKYGVTDYSAEESNLTESFAEPFSQYATSLKSGECSSVIEMESCYAIVKMIDENNEELAEQIMGYYKEDLMKETLESQRIEWYEQMGIEQTPVFKGSVWEKISLYDFVQGMEE